MTTTVGPLPLARTIASLLTPAAFVAREPALVESYRPRPWPRGTAPRVDVYLPPAPSGPLPSLVLVHGGGFTIGSRRMKPARFLATAAVEAGLAVASVDYRKLFQGGRLEEGRDDVLRALEWWGAQQERFGLDPSAVHLAGLSAGGTLSLLASLATPLALRRVISVFALYDLADLGGALPRLLGRLLVGGEREAWRMASPLGQPLFPTPLTILHGSADALTPLHQAQAYAARRRAVGLETEVHVYPDAPHGFFNDARSEVAQAGLRAFLAACGAPSLATPAPSLSAPSLSAR
ncbi:MAG: alpha/beta hydrolase [Planctomycetota bacterium]